MTISKDLFLAILSMDAYNRGYNPGIALDDKSDGTNKVGAATISKNIEDVGIKDAAQAASFYAVAYDVDGADIDGLDSTTVISYRGTDKPASEFPFTDFPLSTLGQWRDPQIAFAQTGCSI